MVKEEVKCTYCKRIFPVEADVTKADVYMRCPICGQTGKNPFYKEEKKDEAETRKV